MLQGRSLGLAPETTAATGALEERQVSDSNQVAPSTPRAGKSQTYTWTCKVTEGIK